MTFFPEPFQDIKAFRAGDIFQVDTAKTGLKHLDKVDQFIGILGINTDRKGVNAAKIFKQQRLAFHNRQARFRTDVT